MQLSRAFFLTPEKTFKRKLTEMMIALELEQKFSKEQIFEFYVNRIDLGQRGSFAISGMGEAEHAYFNKDLKDITLPEAAKGTSRRVHLPTGKDVEVKIPAGLFNGQQIRLKGQGLPGPGAIGDALITVNIAPHPLFERDGNDLRLDLPVALYEAVLGGKVRVPTLDGAVEIAIPAGTSSGRTFRLKGKGFPGKDGTGDLLVTVKLVLPEGGDAELEALMRKWRESKPYDPRKDVAS